jgi:hypothetical protein
MTAKQIISARELCTWPGREEGELPKRRDHTVAKNYLTCGELHKLERLVGRLCRRAEDVAEDGLNTCRWPTGRIWWMPNLR